MRPIGGFFELELPASKGEYHSKALRFNLARNAIVAHLLASRADQVYVPSFCCASVVKSLTNHGISFCYYNINERLEPEFLPELKSRDFFLYVNYFGLKNRFVKEISKRYGENAIIDNSQAFFSLPVASGASVYSARKFFGVPDGAYLYSNKVSALAYAECEVSYSPMHLVNRIEKGPESSYQDYKRSERILRDAGLARMSNLTKHLLRRVEYPDVMESRKSNFEFLHDQLAVLNSLIFDAELLIRKDDEECVPLIYPFLFENGEQLKQELISSKVFVATYWPDVVGLDFSSPFEKFLTRNLVALPVDQRYSKNEMQYISELVKELVGE